MTSPRRQSDQAAPHPLRMGVIGCGPIGMLHARAIATSSNAQLVAVCDTDGRRVETAERTFDVPSYHNIAEMLAARELDAAAIATPDHLHLEPALMAIAAGCHVFCEKPLATGVAEAEQIVRAAVERGVWLGVDYNRRFTFGYRTAKRLLDDGALGVLGDARITVHDRTPPAAVARNPQVIFTTLLTHHFDLLRHFAGEIRSIRAVRAEPPRDNLLRNVTLSLEFTSGASGWIEAGYRDELAGTVESMRLETSGGSLVVEDPIGPVTWTPSDGRQQWFSPDDAETFYDSLIAHVHAFIDKVARDEPPPVTGHDGLWGLRLAEAATQSIHSGDKIEVS